MGFLWPLPPPPCLPLELFALVADTGTVIVEAEVTATELLIEVADDDDDADE